MTIITIHRLPKQIPANFYKKYAGSDGFNEVGPFHTILFDNPGNIGRKVGGGMGLHSHTTSVQVGDLFAFGFYYVSSQNAVGIEALYVLPLGTFAGLSTLNQSQYEVYTLARLYEKLYNKMIARFDNQRFYECAVPGLRKLNGAYKNPYTDFYDVYSENHIYQSVSRTSLQSAYRYDKRFPQFITSLPSTANEIQENSKRLSCNGWFEKDFRSHTEHLFGAIVDLRLRLHKSNERNMSEKRMKEFCSAVAMAHRITT